MVSMLIIGAVIVFAVVATLVLRSRDTSGRMPRRSGRYGAAGGGAYWAGSDGGSGGDSGGGHDGGGSSSCGGGSGCGGGGCGGGS